MTRHCSMPDIFNSRKWFEKNFNNACMMHDNLYAAIIINMTRFQADICLVRYMITCVKDKTLRSKIIIYYPTIALTFVLVRCFGWNRYKG